MENEPTPPEKMERNMITRAYHRREVFWQVTVPLIGGILLILGLAVGIGLAGVGDASLWADIALIWLIVPALVFALILLVLVVGFVYGVTWLLANLPPYAFQAQQVFTQIEAGMRRVTDRIVEPSLRVQSKLAAMRAIRNRDQLGGSDKG